MILSIGAKRFIEINFVPKLHCEYDTIFNLHASNDASNTNKHQLDKLIEFYAKEQLDNTYLTTYLTVIGHITNKINKFIHIRVKISKATQQINILILINAPIFEADNSCFAWLMLTICLSNLFKKKSQILQEHSFLFQNNKRKILKQAILLNRKTIWQKVDIKWKTRSTRGLGLMQHRKGERKIS